MKERVYCWLLLSLLIIGMLSSVVSTCHSPATPEAAFGLRIAETSSEIFGTDPVFGDDDEGEANLP